MAGEATNHSHGLGFRFGLLLGMIAGGLLVKLLSSDEGARGRPLSSEAYGEPETPIATLRAALDTLRGRVIEASREAEEASREVEQRLSARYDDLSSA